MSPEASALLGSHENEYWRPGPNPWIFVVVSFPLQIAVSLAAAVPGRANAARPARATTSAIPARDDPPLGETSLPSFTCRAPWRLLSARDSDELCDSAAKLGGRIGNTCYRPVVAL